MVWHIIGYILLPFAAIFWLLGSITKKMNMLEIMIFYLLLIFVFIQVYQVYRLII